jgi:hypothetical protein
LKDTGELVELLVFTEMVIPREGVESLSGSLPNYAHLNILLHMFVIPREGVESGARSPSALRRGRGFFRDPERGS